MMRTVMDMMLKDEPDVRDEVSDAEGPIWPLQGVAHLLICKCLSPALLSFPWEH